MMSGPDLADFDAVLLDMNGTFMFGHDRFGEKEDYYGTYNSLGGHVLDRATVHQAVTSCFEEMAAKYRDLAWRDKFPSVTDTLRQLCCSANLPDSERGIIADLIACHELGDVPQSHLLVLRKLSSTHKVGVVSNIWSDKRRWLTLFEEHELLDLLDVLVFSSDGPHVKPSPILFEQALSALNVSRNRTLFVGDDPQRDIEGASAVRMRTVLVGDTKADDFVADWQMPSLIDLVQRTPC